MSCKLVKKDGHNAFQCSNIGEFNYMDDGTGIGENVPYMRGECPHDNRFENDGVLICKSCGATYHEDRLSWC